MLGLTLLLVANWQIGKLQTIPTLPDIKEVILSLKHKFFPAALTPVPSPTATPTAFQVPVQRPHYDDQRGLITLDGIAGNLKVNYYTLGQIENGKYKGYKRIVAIMSYGSFYGSYAQIFATNNDQTYIINNNSYDYKAEPAFSDYTKYMDVNRDKIVGEADLDNFPKIIPLSNNFALYKTVVFTDSKQDQLIDSLGNHVSEATLGDDFSSFAELPSNNPQFRFFEDQQKHDSVYDQTKSVQEDDKLLEKYVFSLTNIVVLDKQGLAYTYKLTTLPQSQRFTGTIYPSSSNDKISLGFSKNEVTTNLHLYPKYTGAYSGPCSELPSVMKNISDDELVKIGSYQGRDVYKLKDANHPLYTLLYNFKLSYGFSWEDHWFTIDEPNPKAPSLSHYVDTNPLLFVKDPWGRLIAFGEAYYMNGDGCGKPVIYLYPQTTQKVSVKFDSPMDLTTDIPTYHDGWIVQAEPNGKLTDLQPQFTHCDAIDSAHVGSEYAHDACLTKTYPYLYWAGKSLSNTYPTIDRGWVIERENLQNFLDQTLTKVGLNEKEKFDMLSYWVPVLEKKKAAYYRISFLQTIQMNTLAPMTISPRPDVLFRIFLDWKPLTTRPTVDLLPQNLNTLHRKGFTVVEWGGRQR